jgi:hypothetical protein
MAFGLYGGPWAGIEVEVLDPAGNVVLTTGQRATVSVVYLIATT